MEILPWNEAVVKVGRWYKENIHTFKSTGFTQNIDIPAAGLCRHDSSGYICACLRAAGIINEGINYSLRDFLHDNDELKLNLMKGGFVQVNVKTIQDNPLYVDKQTLDEEEVRDAAIYDNQNQLKFDELKQWDLVIISTGAWAETLIGVYNGNGRWWNWNRRSLYATNDILTKFDPTFIPYVVVLWRPTGIPQETPTLPDSTDNEPPINPDIADEKPKQEEESVSVIEKADENSYTILDIKEGDKSINKPTEVKHTRIYALFYSKIVLDEMSISLGVNDNDLATREENKDGLTAEQQAAAALASGSTISSTDAADDDDIEDDYLQGDTFSVYDDEYFDYDGWEDYDEDFDYDDDPTISPDDSESSDTPPGEQIETIVPEDTTDGETTTDDSENPFIDEDSGTYVYKGTPEQRKDINTFVREISTYNDDDDVNNWTIDEQCTIEIMFQYMPNRIEFNTEEEYLQAYYTYFGQLMYAAVQQIYDLDDYDNWEIYCKNLRK